MKSIDQREKEKRSFLSSEWVYRGKAVNLKVDTYQHEKRKKLTEIVDRTPAVVILPITEDKKILLIQQWRRATEEILIELPAGTLEEGEAPQLCAERELQEETGYKAGKIESLGGFFSAPGYSNEYLHLFLAQELSPSYLAPDEDEGIDLLPLSIKEAKHLIKKNQIRDAKTVAGILRYLMEIKCAN